MHKRNFLLLSLFLLSVLVFAFRSYTTPNGQEPWGEKQLMAPSELAARITDESLAPPLIISVSPIGMHGIRPGKGIKGALEYGPADEKQNVRKLKSAIKDLPRDTEIVLYCGCCPFDVCPNIRPAFALLNKMQFTNHKLLNLEKNIRVDWMNKGYPMNE